LPCPNHCRQHNETSTGHEAAASSGSIFTSNHLVPNIRTHCGRSAFSLVGQCSTRAAAVVRPLLAISKSTDQPVDRISSIRRSIPRFSKGRPGLSQPTRRLAASISGSSSAMMRLKPCPAGICQFKTNAGPRVITATSLGMENLSGAFPWMIVPYQAQFGVTYAEPSSTIAGRWT
jgi:hypothetical protein